ncbi:MAG TPA: peptidoglycan-binding protein [Candidatus Kapabacteria bacterium]|nr:peptidoglycan-binding protein [Candidatus Kapabacteria bacterium]
MDISKKGLKGDEVRDLQRLLNQKGFNLDVDGIFGYQTYNAVKAFQSANLDKHGRPLVVDGNVGLLTWWSLTNPRTAEAPQVIDYSLMPNVSFKGSDIGRKALQEAIKEMNDGAGEIGGNNLGEYVAKYLEPAGFQPPRFWCAPFVSWCFLQASGGNKALMPFNYSIVARDIFNQFKQKGWVFQLNDGSGKIPEPGDIVCWWRINPKRWEGHIGFVHHSTNDGFLYTIEGNKSAKVQGFDYVTSRMDKLLGFGRAV